MDSYEGDLADIVRASSGGVIKSTTPTPNDLQILPEWQFGSSNPDLCPFPDPLLTGSLPPFDVEIEDPQTAFYGGDGCGSGLIISNFNMFSRALQISPDMHTCDNNINTNTTTNNSNTNNSVKTPVAVAVEAAPPRVMKTAYEMMSIDGGGSPNDGGFLDSSNSGIQIRNPGIKRRKSQAKKVVCIPAPAGANSRQSGEVVPSDLWAWRKYGQKPIKGSPYPRGYYRCSSSKGCSARKQVERSRTDPNMLVITYTSEHNHPWPTQRNALAGSTRSQPTKIITAAATSSNPAPVKEEKDTQQNNEGKEEIVRTQNGENNSQDFFAELGFFAESGLFDWGAPNSAATNEEDERVKRVIS